MKETHQLQVRLFHFEIRYLFLKKVNLWWNIISHDVLTNCSHHCRKSDLKRINDIFKRRLFMLPQVSSRLFRSLQRWIVWSSEVNCTIWWIVTEKHDSFFLNKLMNTNSLYVTDHIMQFHHLCDILFVSIAVEKHSNMWTHKTVCSMGVGRFCYCSMH